MDANGGPVIDPTQNVLDLVQAAIQRQDDLRNAEAAHTRELLGLKTAHDEELRVAEAARVDAIRTVDVNAAAILATQVAASAEALRGQVEAARLQTAAGLTAALGPINKDISELRQYQWTGQGGHASQVEARVEQRESGIDMRAILALVISAAAVLSAFLLGVTGIVITLLLRTT